LLPTTNGEINQHWLDWQKNRRQTPAQFLAEVFTRDESHG
jgi:hypothetical protein